LSARKVLCCVSMLLASSAMLVGADLSGEMWFGLGLDDDTLFTAFDVGMDVRYTIGGIELGSTSILTFPGLWIWQDFGARGTAGAFDWQTNVLFGPSTADYLYAEAIAAFSLGAVDIAIHGANISSAVVDGPADGGAIRLAGSIGSMDVVLISELGARIEDDDFGGMTMVHAATGLEYHFATDPIVFGQGFTGQKATVGGFSLGRCDDLTATVYMSCVGFEYASFTAEGIDLGLPWLKGDVTLSFETETKSLTLEPTIAVGTMLCLTPYLALSTPTAPYIIEDIMVVGFEFAATWNGVTVRDVTVLDSARYAITTETSGSQFMSKAMAFDKGYGIYSDYFEMLSLEVVRGGGCCGGESRFLANVYFDGQSFQLFDWGMVYTSFELPINERLHAGLAVSASQNGLELFYVTTRIRW